VSSKATESVGTTFGAGYTVALFVFAVLAGMVAWIEIGLIGELVAESETLWATVLRIDQVAALLLSPLSLLTAIARSRRWLVAHLLTRVASIALAIVVPIGTALFVYWLVWVRKREAPRTT